MSQEHDFEEYRASGGLSTINETDPDDIFITSASFEPRSGSVVDVFRDDYRAKNGIVYVNRELLDEQGTDRTQENLKKIKADLKKHCDQVKEVKGSWLDISDQLDAIKSALVSVSAESDLKISIDVTTFNRESLMVLLNLIYNRHQHPQTRILYISPNSHGEWLSRGHRGIRNIIGLTGLHQSSRPTVLILLSGFESDRALKLIEEFEPAKVLLGVGDPPTEERFLDRNIQEQTLILNRQDTNQFEFPANDISGSYECLSEIIKQELVESNVVVAPMSTKLSTVGAWRAARDHLEVQVTYSIPGEYNQEGYSEGIKDLYIDYIPHS